MKEIQLTQGKFALVDDEDFEYLNQWKWYAFKNHQHDPNANSFYAVRSVRFLKPNGAASCKRVWMHRFLMGNPEEVQVDHKDRDSLNNQKSNLRVSDHSENMRNREKTVKNTSGYLGVSKDRRCKSSYQARIRNGKVEVYLGTFHSAEEAAKIRDKFAIELHGNFAVLNFPQEGVKF